MKSFFRFLVLGCALGSLAAAEQALRAYTWGSAYGAHQDADRGTLRPGKFADLVVLSRDILDDAERNTIATTRVELTMVGGKVVYERR